MKITCVPRWALALLSASIGVLPASAACNRSVSTYNSATGAYCYWHSSFYQQTLHASIWSGGTDHTGTCNESPGILYFGVNPGDFGINLNLGEACATGCPSGPLSILASATDGFRSETLVAQAPYTPAGGVDFDFSQTGSRALGVYPPPRITSTSRVGDHLIVNFSIAGISVYDGAGSGITGFNILSATSIIDPGRFATAYTFVTNIPSPGGTGGAGSFVGDCPINNNADVWIVTQIVTAAGPSKLVSEARRMRCQIFAEPTRKFNKSVGTQFEN